jgi:hypothetical protein
VLVPRQASQQQQFASALSEQQVHAFTQVFIAIFKVFMELSATHFAQNGTQPGMHSHGILMAGTSSLWQEQRLHRTVNHHYIVMLYLTGREPAAADPSSPVFTCSLCGISRRGLYHAVRHSDYVWYEPFLTAGAMIGGIGRQSELVAESGHPLSSQQQVSNGPVRPGDIPVDVGPRLHLD